MTMTRKELFNELSRLGFEIAKEENLQLKEIKQNPKGNVRGRCSTDGIIWLRLHNSPVMTNRMKWQENGRTLCHELAHLRHMNHDKEFWSYASELCNKLSQKVNITIPPERAHLLIK